MCHNLLNSSICECPTLTNDYKQLPNWADNSYQVDIFTFIVASADNPLGSYAESGLRIDVHELHYPPLAGSFSFAKEVACRPCRRRLELLRAQSLKAKLQWWRWTRYESTLESRMEGGLQTTDKGRWKKRWKWYSSTGTKKQVAREVQTIKRETEPDEKLSLKD